ncbi:3-hydroxyacyl-CoA dehydrogenase family protein [Mesorhizobium sp. B4-1-4]|uniref:3-hydroxyacyl-CoA dehydrogenase family protein n=1 Tax=Mesorhizobium sp. B4-1-4 TaxID=2589888 RepID=UPI001AEF0A3B|nr:3-hydroxyacyl-CoA dehydrogenase NAD-binding domain-containing protein [Mesorhizobium sp. B4-1-4]UCI31916.1 3-hydroxyacyl-CoA dehydrogenase family protein [Mesorhizobium sp. B4-1-4]
MKNVTVVGAGLMGLGIAQIFAARYYSVTVQDISIAALDRMPETIARIGDLLGNDPETSRRIRTTTDLGQAVGQADLVIEAAAEKLEVKQSIFSVFEKRAPGEAILASNTSVIPISQIAVPVTDKRRVMGMHFWNPPYLVPLVEVVEIPETGHLERDRIMQLLTSVGQEPVLVRRDIPGFIGNRLQHALKREAIALVANGICDAETVDRVIKLGFGSRLGVIGTLEQSDMVGLNLTLDIHNVVIPDLDVTQGPHPYLQQLVAAGHLGMKTGKGFYEWTEERAEAVRERLKTFLARQAEGRRELSSDHQHGQERT